MKNYHKRQVPFKKLPNTVMPRKKFHAMHSQWWILICEVIVYQDNGGYDTYESMDQVCFESLLTSPNDTVEAR